MTVAVTLMAVVLGVVFLVNLWVLPNVIRDIATLEHKVRKLERKEWERKE